MAVTLVGASHYSSGGYYTYDMAPHAGTAAGDWQVGAWVSFTDQTPVWPAGWTLLGNYKTAYANIYLHKRQLTDVNKAQRLQIPYITTHSAVLWRTYRGCTDIVIAGQGTGLTAPSRVVNGKLLRVFNDSENNLASFPPNKKLILPAGLESPTDQTFVNYTWFNGLVEGDDPTLHGQTAPTRTTQNLDLTDGVTDRTRAPQWVDVMMLAPITSVRKLRVGTGTPTMKVGSNSVARAYVGTNEIYKEG